MIPFKKTSRGLVLEIDRKPSNSIECGSCKQHKHQHTISGDMCYCDEGHAEAHEGINRANCLTYADINNVAEKPMGCPYVKPKPITVSLYFNWRELWIGCRSDMELATCFQLVPMFGIRVRN